MGMRVRAVGYREERGKHMSKKIETERLILRNFEPTDLDGLHQLLTDKDAMYYVDMDIPQTIEDTARILVHLMANDDGQYFCIEDKQTGDFVGRIGYKGSMMGFMLLPSQNGKGYAGEAGRAVVDYAFDQGGLAQLSAGCYKDNIAMQKLLAKLGFAEDSVTVEVKEHHGALKEKLIYTIAR